MKSDPGWLRELVDAAPDFVAPYRAYRNGRLQAMKQACRVRSGPGSAARLAAEHAAVARHVAGLLAAVPPGMLAASGATGDWSIVQTIGHMIAAREGLALAALLTATGRWPSAAGSVVPGLAGREDVTLPALHQSLARSQRFIERAALRVAGHESDPCELDHPLVGHFRCGGWLLFAGVHDLMHLEQLDRLVTTMAIDGTGE